MIVCADSEHMLAGLPDDSVDLIVTDPPYGWEFMGKDWDKAVPSVKMWKECLRVLKPGAFAFVMSGPRMDCLSEMGKRLAEAGFEIGFSPIYWAYASGFPKAANMGKLVDKRAGRLGKSVIALKEELRRRFDASGKTRSQIDKECGFRAANYLTLPSKDKRPDPWVHVLPSQHKWKIMKTVLGCDNGLDDELDEIFAEAEREVIATRTKRESWRYKGNTVFMSGEEDEVELDVTLPATPEAQALDGSYAGFQPKPALECVVTCQKPLTLCAELIIITSQALGLIQEVIQWSSVNSAETSLSRSQTLRDYIAPRIATGKLIEEAITQAGAVGGPYDQTGMLKPILASMKSDTESMSWNTGLLWKSILADVLSRANRYTTAMATGLITDLKTLTLLLSQTIQASITQDETQPSGAELNVIAVESLLISALTKSLSLDDTSAQRDALMSSFILGAEGAPVSIAGSPSSGEAKASSGNTVRSNAIGTTVIIVAMKPLAHGTYIDQALDNRHGVTWLDDCRVPCENRPWPSSRSYGTKSKKFDTYENTESITQSTEPAHPSGRFPANLLCSDDVLNDGRVLGSSGGRAFNPANNVCYNEESRANTMDGERLGYGDSGSFSRYFSLDAWAIANLPESVQRTFPFLIVPKAGKKEKNLGCEGLEEAQVRRLSGGNYEHNSVTRKSDKCGGKVRNAHPTVKPLKLMSYLVTLGSRPGDLILDPFAGTCTTGMAAKVLGRDYLMIELDEQWCQIGQRRIEAAEERLI